jgi:hypothetical protein
MACSSAEGGRLGKAWRLLALVLGLGSALLAPAAVCAADIETRDFTVFVSGKRSGEVHMTIHRKDKGLVEMRCDTDIKVSTLLFTYKYSYRGQETWKDNRLVKFESNTDDNGTRYNVSAVAEAAGVRVTVNNASARMVKPEVWLSSYWSLPDPKIRNQVLPIIDADNGKDLDSRLSFVATERRSVAGQVVALNHYRLVGKATVDLWYDGADRLVRQEWVEQGHRTILELNRVRK